MSKHQRKKRHWFFSRWFFIANIIVFVLLLMAFGREYVGNIQIRQEIQKNEDERLALEQNQSEILSFIEELSSEYYLEREGRQNYGLAKPGETLIVLEDNQDDQHDVEIEEYGARSNIMYWFYYFFDQETFTEIKDQVEGL